MRRDGAGTANRNPRSSPRRSTAHRWARAPKRSSRMARPPMPSDSAESSAAATGAAPDPWAAPNRSDSSGSGGRLTGAAATCSVTGLKVSGAPSVRPRLRRPSRHPKSDADSIRVFLRHADPPRMPEQQVMGILDSQRLDGSLKHQRDRAVTCGGHAGARHPDQQRASSVRSAAPTRAASTATPGAHNRASTVRRGSVHAAEGADSVLRIVRVVCADCERAPPCRSFRW